MCLLKKFVVLLLLTSGIFISIKLYDIFKVIKPGEYFGPGAARKDDTSIKAFKIEVTNEELSDLKHRLDNARPFTPPLEDTAHDYGLNTKILNEIVQYWRTEYNWIERQKYFNTQPHFTTEIQGLKIHFLQYRATNVGNKRVLPILLLHGWPSTFTEFNYLAKDLITPKPKHDFVFDVIVPSLPGFGFSDGPSKENLGFPQMAQIFKTLMLRLGYDKFYVQGGDLGSFVAKELGVFYSEHVLGVHLNLCTVSTPLSHVKKMLSSVWPSLLVRKEREHRLYPMCNVFSRLILESGYFHIQATKPDTIGVGLDDSPVGLAAYILEKFISATNYEYVKQVDGGLKLKYNYVDLIDNIMIYWWSKSMTTAVRTYTQFLPYNVNNHHRMQLHVPSACAQFKNEIIYNPPNLLKEIYVNLVQNNEYEYGGHFIPLEDPVTFSDDIAMAVEKFDKFYQ